MHIAIPDDYQDCVRGLDCYASLAAHQVTIYRDHTKDPDELARRFADADAIVLTRERTAVDAALLDRLPRLRLISQIGKTAAHIDLAACTARGIAVAEGSGSGAATAELTWALMLASRRHLVSEVNGLRAGRWQASLGQQLRGQRLGVWSYGRIGRQVAAYGAAFGMKVWVWGGPGSTADARGDGVEVAPTREAFFARSDVVTLHLRLSGATRGAVTAADLARMGPRALLVNTSRAELIEAGALEAALRAGAPGYAAVDTFESEPVLGADHPLLHLDNALCTPHLGFVEKDNYEAYFGTAFDNINRFFAGTPANLANPEVLGHLRAS
ncbi:D-2-hydroxyacid dehydrogenase family protein [Achromobacter aloeverae]|uniref:3-phosphoglycerate dehydrogenase n=1 Tax=Achromobacter aloeverae TaxID=1750518 RepID=A0A4V1MRY7_9BURK|nr:D-2-hydroxyacid dehydrogenase family protein [Achromobacter aloeverae]RXN86958.1 3-phosphoglycerate dehydrogenase [Achromobacter aloeverae]